VLYLKTALINQRFMCDLSITHKPLSSFPFCPFQTKQSLDHHLIRELPRLAVGGLYIKQCLIDYIIIQTPPICEPVSSDNHRELPLAITDGLDLVIHHIFDRLHKSRSYIYHFNVLPYINTLKPDLYKN
jgi:hypothetical protein